MIVVKILSTQDVGDTAFETKQWASSHVEACLGNEDRDLSQLKSSDSDGHMAKTLMHFGAFYHSLGNYKTAELLFGQALDRLLVILS